MLDKLKQVEDRYEELCARAEQPDFYADPKKAAAWLREQKELAPIVAAYRAYCAAQRDMQDAAELMAGQADAELKALCQEELTGAKKRAAALEQELRVLLLPHDPNDGKNVILEIRPGVGGEESALFAHSLFRMYSLYAAARGWTVELLNYSETELGGIKEADFMICGAGAYSRLKFESGVHRVQRVPETESGGRVHTSTATVAVLPEMEQADVDLRPEDIEMQVYRSSGAGGQHINKTSSAVRLIHRPTGIVVACQEERSQFQNRERCMMMLSSKLYQLEQERIESAVSSERRSQVGSGMRNEKIRTYNFPQSRVTDHRIGLTLYQLDSILNGGLDPILDALIAADQAEKLRRSESSDEIMKTQMLSAQRPEDIAAAAGLLRNGKLVAIPTETVYGLGQTGSTRTPCCASSRRRGARRTTPSFCISPSRRQLESICHDIPAQAWLLAEHFWPGPLTMVLPVRDLVPKRTTAGLDTVAVRCPKTAATRELIRLAGVPIAAPSANRSGKPSTTTAAHVLH